MKITVEIREMTKALTLVQHARNEFERCDTLIDGLKVHTPINDIERDWIANELERLREERDLWRMKYDLMTDIYKMFLPSAKIAREHRRN